MNTQLHPAMAALVEVLAGVAVEDYLRELEAAEPNNSAHPIDLSEQAQNRGPDLSPEAPP